MPILNQHDVQHDLVVIGVFVMTMKQPLAGGSVDFDVPRPINDSAWRIGTCNTNVCARKVGASVRVELANIENGYRFILHSLQVGRV